MNERSRREIDGDRIVRRFGVAAVAGRMVLDPQLLRIGNDTQITVVGVVVVLKHDLPDDLPRATALRGGLNDLRSAQRAAAPSADLLQRVTAVASDDVGNLRLGDRLAPNLNRAGSREALVVV